MRRQGYGPKAHSGMVGYAGMSAATQLLRNEGSPNPANVANAPLTPQQEPNNE
jgi:hypothetical protein